MAIEISGVTKRFDKVAAVDNVTVTFGDNKIYGLLGNNGAGKSTLMNMISGRLPAEAGTITVDGVPVSSDAALGKVFLASDQNLFPDSMKVEQAIKTAAWFYPDFDAAYARELSDRFGLNRKKKINKLSTGYGSIFRLILALSVNTPYLLLDEPVLGLDAQHRDLFYRVLVEKYAERPATIIISTHLIAEVENIMEEAVIIRSGKIMQQAAVSRLTQGLYAVAGPKAAVEAYIAGKSILSRMDVGGLVTATVEGTPEGALPAGLELSKPNLQDYFIDLMNREDAK